MKFRFGVFCALCVFCVACGDPSVNDADAAGDGASDAEGALDAAIEDAADGGTSADAADDGDADVVVPLPSVYFVEPTEPVFAASQAVALRAVSTSPVDQIDVLVDGHLFANLAAPYEWSLPTAALSAGAHTIMPRGVVGGRTIDGTPFTLHIDRTPIAAIDADDISVGSGLTPGMRTPIVVTFDEPLHATSAAALGFAVRIFVDSNSVPVAGSFTVSGATVTFVPTLPWLEARRYRITLGGHVIDRAGNETALNVVDDVYARTYWVTTNTSINRAQNVAVRGNGDYVVAGIDTSGANQYGDLTGHGRVAGERFDLPYTGSDVHYQVHEVRAGVDGAGVVYVAWVGATSQDARALFVARRDPSTGAWTRQTLWNGAIGSLVFVVAKNGHAFAHFAADEMRTFRLAPGEDLFTEVTFDDVVISSNVAFPGDLGRVCGVHSVHVSMDPHAQDDFIVCEGGGAPDHAVQIGVRHAEWWTPEMVAGENGDALVRVHDSVYAFDPSTESVSFATTLILPNASPAMSVGPLGHACLAYSHDHGAGYAVHVRTRPPGGAFGQPAVAVPNPSVGLVLQVGVDAAGHCFVTMNGATVTHDATVDGAYAPTYSIGSASSILRVGAENQAFVTADGTWGIYLRTFVPLSP